MVKNGSTKSAEGVLDTLKTQRAELNNAQLWRNLRNIALVGGGVGIGARGLQGIYNLLRRNFTPRPRPVYAPLTFDVPVQEEEEKTANWLSSFMSGGEASSSATHPLAIPLGMTAAGGSLYGGWKLMDWLMDQRRKDELESELSQAKKEYEESLAGQFKTGSLGDDLDKLYDRFEKEATVGDVAGPTLGTILALMGGTGLLSGVVTYNLTKKRLQRNLMDKAYRRHLQKVRRQRPPVIMARPLPMPAPKPLKPAPDEDELNGEPLDKVAQVPGSGQIMPRQAGRVPTPGTKKPPSAATYLQGMGQQAGGFRPRRPSQGPQTVTRAPQIPVGPQTASQPAPRPQRAAAGQQSAPALATPSPQGAAPQIPTGQIPKGFEQAHQMLMSNPQWAAQWETADEAARTRALNWAQQRVAPPDPQALLQEGYGMFANRPGVTPEQARRWATEYSQMSPEQRTGLQKSLASWDQTRAQVAAEHQAPERPAAPPKPRFGSPTWQRGIEDQAAQENAVALNKRMQGFGQRHGIRQPAPVTPEQLLGRPLTPSRTPEDTMLAGGDSGGEASGFMSIPNEDVSTKERRQEARERKSKLWHEARPVRYVDPAGNERFFTSTQERDQYVQKARQRKRELAARKQRVRRKRSSANHPLLSIG